MQQPDHAAFFSSIPGADEIPVRTISKRNYMSRQQRIEKEIAYFQSRVNTLSQKAPTTSQQKRVLTIAQRCLASRQRDMKILKSRFAYSE